MNIKRLIEAREKLDRNMHKELEEELTKEIEKAEEFAEDLALISKNKNTFALFDGAEALFTEFRSRIEGEEDANLDHAISGMISVIPYTLEEIQSSLMMMMKEK